MKSSRGSRFAITSSPAVGHLDLTGDIGNRASLWSFLAFSWKPFDEATLPHMWQPYERAGLTTPSKSHLTRRGAGPHMVPMAALWRRRDFLAAVNLSLMCWVNVSL